MGDMKRLISDILEWQVEGQEAVQMTDDYSVNASWRDAQKYLEQVVSPVVFPLLSAYCTRTSLDTLLTSTDLFSRLSSIDHCAFLAQKVQHTLLPRVASRMRQLPIQRAYELWQKSGSLKSLGGVQLAFLDRLRVHCQSFRPEECLDPIVYIKSIRHLPETSRMLAREVMPKLVYLLASFQVCPDDQ